MSGAPEQVEMPIMLEHVDVRELTDGLEVRQAFVVTSVEKRQKQNGDPYLQLMIGDKTGTIECMVWPVRNSQYDEVARVTEFAEVGNVIAVRGKVEVHPQYGPRLIPTEADGLVAIKRARDGEYDIDRLVRGPARPVADLESELLYLVQRVREPLRTLLGMFFHEPGTVIGPGQDAKVEHSPFYAAFREAPAARGVHQAYKHGLIEHTVSVAEGVDAIIMSGAFGDRDVLDRDLAVTGALLHDIGKVDLYTRDGMSPEMTTVGMLHGEIPLTYMRVRQAIDALDEFPAVLRESILHIVVSHHGRTDWGAVVEPVTREAWIVHCVDLMAARVGGLDVQASTVPPGEEWSARDKKRGRGWFPVTDPDAAPAPDMPSWVVDQPTNDSPLGDAPDE